MMTSEYIYFNSFNQFPFDGRFICLTFFCCCPGWYNENDFTVLSPSKWKCFPVEYISGVKQKCQVYECLFHKHSLLSPPLSPSLSLSASPLSPSCLIPPSLTLSHWPEGLSYFLWDENSHNLQRLSLCLQISKPCISKEALLKFRKSFLSLSRACCLIQQSLI